MSGMMEKFVVLPFPSGCLSQSTISEGKPQTFTNQAQRDEKAAAAEGEELGNDGGSDDHRRKKKRSILSAGLQKLFKSLKGLLLASQLFPAKVAEEEGEGDDDDDMEIGYPTDVKHVGHIGWDGFSKPNSLLSAMKDWNKPPSGRAPILSLNPFESSM